MLDELNPNQWGEISGIEEAAMAGVRVHGVWNQTGDKLNAWLRLQWRDGKQVLLHATTDLALIEQEMQSLPQGVDPNDQQAVSGWFGGLKKLVRKSGLGRVAKGLVSVAKTAINNPLVKTALMATPAGQVAMGVMNGARVVQSALRGNLNAKNFLQFALRQATAGNPGAMAALKLLRAGARNVPQLARYVPGQFMASGAYDRQWIGLCAGDVEPVPDDQVRIDEDADLIMTMASAGNFEGVRWFIDRMKPQAMVNSPNAFGTRDALLLGREAAASRFFH